VQSVIDAATTADSWGRLVSALGEAVLVLDVEGVILFANPAAGHLLDRPAESLVGFPFSLPAASTGTSEIELILPGGRLRLAEATVQPGSWQDQDAWVVSLHDIHERKMHEARLRMASHVFSSAHEAILITDPKGQILDVNSAFTRVTGYALEEALGKTPQILKSGLHDDDFYQRLWSELLSKGGWSGEMWNRRKSGEVYLQRISITSIRDEREQIQFFIGFTEDITDLRQHEQHLEFIAQHDSLTKLPNRVLLSDRLQQGMAHAERNGKSLALAYIDLDGFKEINDALGHPAGDALLVGCARNMKQALRDADTLSRIGGDEFVAVIVDLFDLQDALPLFDRLLQAASLPVVYEGHELQVSASLGVTLYPQSDQQFDADQLLRQADQAMYQAKLNGRNRYHLFDVAMDSQLKGIQQWHGDIARGLAAEEFVLFYQPKVDLRTGQVFGFEALVRWQHPDKGLMMPGDFLPYIERHDLMLRLGNWVLDQALRQIQRWHEQGQDFEVSVNISARQLQDDFIDTLSGHLANWPGVPPRLLTLEVLETSALDDLARISEIIRQANRLGIDFSLDDFGTGYSSLAYLKRLPVSQIKIDRLFVQEMTEQPDDFAIIEGIMGLASAFRLEVVAEGMEHPEQGVLLLQLGCQRAQGYGIARPMPQEQVQAWLCQWRPEPAWSVTPVLSKDKINLLYACIEHKVWNKSLCGYMAGVKEQPPERSHDGCRFGHWLSQQPGYPFLPGHPLRLVYEMHLSLHQVAEQWLLASGPSEQRLAQDKYLELSSGLLAQLRLMMGLYRVED
jgi:diguanylate cyclase (GGDEF)-like protein/PAS domain S-box-containing protein